MINLENIPNILYKYRDYANENNKRTLFNFELFLASTSMFNDPYEGSIPFIYEPNDLTPENIFLKLLELAKHDHPDWKDQRLYEYCFEGQQKDLLHDEVHIERENEKNKEAIDKSFGILSLTIHPLNYLMWSHYGNSHTGFCIGFDKYILDEIINGTISPVNYDSKIPKLRLFEEIQYFHIKQLATKSDIWSYEYEYRIVKSNASRETIKYPKEMINPDYSSAEELGIINYCAIFLTVGFYKNSIIS
jgi:hypothetical protein